MVSGKMQIRGEERQERENQGGINEGRCYTGHDSLEILPEITELNSYFKTESLS